MKNNTSKFWGVLDNALVSFLPQKAQFEILKSSKKAAKRQLPVRSKPPQTWENCQNGSLETLSKRSLENASNWCYHWSRGSAAGTFCWKMSLESQKQCLPEHLPKVLAVNSNVCNARRICCRRMSREPPYSIRRNRNSNSAQVPFSRRFC